MPVEAAPEAETMEADNQSIIGGASADEPQDGGQSIIGGASAGDDEAGDEKAENDEQAAESEDAEGGEDGEKDDAPEGAPEEYAAFDLPEGIELNEEANTEFTTLAKELNLPQSEAQKLVSIAAGMMQKQAEAIQQRIEDNVNAWDEEARADEEIGGTKFNETRRYAALARDEFATPELVQFLEDTKLGSNPEIVRLFARVGKAIGEDTFVQSGRATPQSKPFFDHPTSVSTARA